ncbi:uncharacterized protein JCM15063_002616 [Sporobolomyces koalae]|uniref:uncharacterized protein n=1 Tax=Sporobolomyces koalae TaxID=500713 RepID=UPI003172EEB1
MSGRSATPKLQTTKQAHPSPAPSPVGRSNSASSTASVTPIDLSTLLNLQVELRTVDGRTLSGTLYTYDPILSIVVISCPSSPSPSSTSSSSSTTAFNSKRKYHLIKTSQINQVSIESTVPDPLFPSPSTPLPSSSSNPSPTSTSLAHKVQTRVALLDKERLRIGPPGTTAEQQNVFDALAKTLPVRWHGTQEIVVMDEVVVDTREWNVRGAKGSKDRIDRVMKVLEGVRARVSSNSSTPTLER